MKNCVFCILFFMPINLNFFLSFFKSSVDCQPSANVLPSLSIYDPSFCRVSRPGSHQSAPFFSFPGDWTCWTGSRAFRPEKSLWLAVQLSVDEKRNRKRKPVAVVFMIPTTKSPRASWTFESDKFSVLRRGIFMEEIQSYDIKRSEAGSLTPRRKGSARVRTHNLSHCSNQKRVGLKWLANAALIFKFSFFWRRVQSTATSRLGVVFKGGFLAKTEESKSWPLFL